MVRGRRWERADGYANRFWVAHLTLTVYTYTERASLTIGDLALIDSNVAGRAGGAFAVEDATATMVVGATATITNNTAATGGAIAGTLGANIVLGASARLSSNVATSGQGRAVSLGNASLSFGSFATVTSNGGGTGSSVLDVDADSYLRMGRVRIYRCRCVLVYGYVLLEH